MPIFFQSAGTKAGLKMPKCIEPFISKSKIFLFFVNKFIVFYRKNFVLCGHRPGIWFLEYKLCN